MRRIRWVSILLLLALAAPAVSAPPDLADAWGRLPLAFEENRGQTDPNVLFLARAPGHEFFLTTAEAVLVPFEGAGALHLRWLDAAPAPRVQAEGKLSGRAHYFLGNEPARWRTVVPLWSRVRLERLWPGIDLVFYGNPQELEHDFVVAPGADPGQIVLALDGAAQARIDDTGDLVVGLEEGGEVRLRKPVAYQEIGTTRREVPCRFQLLPGNRLTFALETWDRKRPLIIDPVLVFSTRMGTIDYEQVQDLAVDGEGNVYLGGFVESQGFPGGPPSQGQHDALIVKLAPSGELVYVALIGGSRSDYGFGLAVDAAGSAYIAGVTRSSDFPRVRPPAGQPPYNAAEQQAFVAKLDPAGSRIEYATNLGGSVDEFGFDVAVDPQGHAYVVGYSRSLDFPIVGGLPPPRNALGPQDGFVTKLTPEGDRFVWSTLLGGNSSDIPYAVAVDTAGHAHVVGQTDSTDFPQVHAALGPDDPFHFDGFLAKLHPAGTSLVYSTYLGGSDHDQAVDVAVDRAGRACVTGITSSQDFPMVHALQPYRGGADAFLSCFGPGGALLSSTYLGGSGTDEGHGVAVDAGGHVFVAGATDSTDVPLATPSPSCRSHCGTDAFLIQLDPTATRLLGASLLGGSDYDIAFAAGADPFGGIWIAGLTSSTDFPEVNPLPLAGGGIDVFAARFVTNRPPGCAAALARPDRLWPPNGKLQAISISGVTDPDNDPVTLRVTAIRQDEPLSRKGQPDATGIGTAKPMVRADRAGGGDGRVYRLRFAADDGRGGSCEGEVTVCVPHNQRGRGCGDGGALVDSTGSGR